MEEKKIKKGIELDDVEFNQATESNGASWPLKDGSRMTVYYFSLTEEDRPEYSFAITQDNGDKDWRGWSRFDVSDVYQGLLTTRDLEQKQVKVYQSFRAESFEMAECKSFDIIYERRLRETCDVAVLVDTPLSRDEMEQRMEEDILKTNLSVQRYEEEKEMEEKKKKEAFDRASSGKKALKKAESLSLF